MHARVDRAGVWWMRDNIRNRLKHRKTTRLWIRVRAWTGNIQGFRRSVPSRQPRCLAAGASSAFTFFDASRPRCSTTERRGSPYTRCSAPRRSLQAFPHGPWPCKRTLTGRRSPCRRSFRHTSPCGVGRRGIPTSDNISLAVGDGARRMTYAELATVRATSQASAQRLVRRKHWPRQVGNDGVVLVLVPLDEARKDRKCW